MNRHSTTLAGREIDIKMMYTNLVKITQSENTMLVGMKGHVLSSIMSGSVNWYSCSEEQSANNWKLRICKAHINNPSLGYIS